MATLYPDGGRIGSNNNTPARDAGGGGETGRVDAGMDAGRDARAPIDGSDDEDEPGDDDSADDAMRPVDAGAQNPTFVLSSPDVRARALIPNEFRCKNAVSPALSWTPGPEGTQSYAIQLRDPSAETALRSYWLLYDVPADVTSLPRMIPRQERVEEPPARQALDDSRRGTYGYYGPCVEASLELSVHALDVAELPGVSADAGAAVISAAVSAHELSKATMVVQSAGQDESEP